MTASYTVTMDGTITESLGVPCYVAQANFIAGTNQGSCSYTVESNDGYITASIQVVEDPEEPGSYLAAAGFALNNQSIPSKYQGTYSEEAVPAGTGCITFTTIEVAHGGGLTGSVDCSLMGGSDTAPLPATLSGTFDCGFAP